MALDRGLPSVPQGLPRGLTVYLQNLHAYLLRLAGNVRGASDSRAVRRSEMAGYTKTTAPGEHAITSDMLRDGSVTEKKLADNAVTGKKIADAAIEGKKLVQGAIGSRELAAGAVDSDALMNGAVSGEKLADAAVSSAKLEKGLLTVTLSGEAEDGAEVELPGEWEGMPAVCVTGFSLPSFPAGAGLDIRAARLRREGDAICFDAMARAVIPADEEAGAAERTVSGKMFWLAVGRR